jgi:catechol 2,3-dioxygenase-like lactoylglutathione lyase family enzyme
MIQALHHIGIAVEDLDEAVRLWRDTLGLVFHGIEHHLAFKADSTQRTIDELKGKGAPLLDERPRPGAHGTKVAFVHPKGLKGVLAEIVEDPS